PDVIQQLLDLPAPRLSAPPPSTLPALAGYDAKTLPPENAPVEVLEAYWSTGGPNPGKAQMPASVRARFLNHAEQRPDKLSFLLEQDLLADTPETHARVKALMEAGLQSYYDQTEEAEVRRYEEIWRTKLRAWLMLHSSFYLDELEQKARAAKDDNGEIVAEQYLQALAQLDWERAQPLLDNYAYSPQPRTATLALTLLYKHAVASQSIDATNLRARLQEFVANQQAPGGARSLACAALMHSPWEGRDEWFLTLFADDSLRVMEDSGSGTLYPLNKPVQADPEHWIPLLAQLVGHSNPALPEAAVDCLARFDVSAPRKEALQLLLPWLANPNWSAAEGRKELIQSLAKVTLPEAVPGLLWVVENDEDTELSLAAAEALAAQQDQRAVPALKRLLARSLSPTERTIAVEALVVCGGLSDDEMARAIESYATRIALTGKGDLAEKIERLDDFDDNLPLQIALGKVLSETEKPRETVATRLLDRMQRLEKTQPALARLLLAVVQKWNLRVVDADIVARIAANKADLRELEYALKIRPRLRQSVSDELQAVAVRRGAAAGIAAVILADETLFYKILGDDDKASQRALLAAARLTRTPLPLPRIGEWLDDGTLKLAAERYLISDDNAEARALILAKHPGEALILGATAEADAKPRPGAALFAKWEEKARKEVLAQDGADEIIALLSPHTFLRTSTVTTANGTFTSSLVGQSIIVIRVRKDKAELAWRTDDAREQVRELTATEWHELQTFLREKKIDDLPARDSNTSTVQSEYEFLRLTKHGGRRVYIANLDEAFGNQDLYSLLLRQIRRLTESKGFRVRYDLDIQGFEVVLADEKYPVVAVCGEGGRLRVLVRQRQPMLIPGSNRMEAVPVASEWYEINANQLGLKVEPPKSCRMSVTADAMSPRMLRAAGSAFSNYIIHSPQGIVRVPPLPKTEIIAAGDYQDLLESPDGQWLFAVKGSSTGPKTLVKIELSTRQETTINFAVTGTIKLFAAIPGTNKFLFEQQLNNGESQMYLLSPTTDTVETIRTGTVEKVKGDPRPLPRQPQRTFQPTGQPDEVWAAALNPRRRATDIGRYNLQTLSFTPITAIPELSFTSDAFWVDEAAKSVYIVYRGHLLRFPLSL
ncbi:MAG TPA: HEAT repeat domain-containing protein, partial [Blastocatellia bacterium]|nr:HEAT repeat domain-containing protein [Blastocatellia bacterium]